MCHKAEADLSSIRERSITTRVAEDDWVAAEAAFHDQYMQRLYGFCVADFRPACYWFEPCDIFRKLALSGLLQFVEQGSVFQVVFGCGVSVGWLAVHLYVQPSMCSPHQEQNVLKAYVDGQIFFVFLISFVVRVLPYIPTDSTYTATTYGWVLVVSLGIFCMVAVALTVASIMRQRRFRTHLSSAISAEFNFGAFSAPVGADSATESSEAGFPARQSNPAHDLAPDRAQPRLIVDWLAAANATH